MAVKGWRRAVRRYTGDSGSSAVDEAQARELGQPALAKLYRENLGKDVPTQTHTVPLPTDVEIELMKWHDEMVACETK